MVIKDEKQLRKIEGLIEEGISTAQLCREISVDPKTTLQLLSRADKSVIEYEKLCLKDGELSFKAMEFGSLRYMGQVRLMAVYGEPQESASSAAANNHNQRKHSRQQGNDSEVDYEYTKCGYGKLICPDGSSFEGYWING